MTLNVQDPAPVLKVEKDPLPYTDQFTYLGSTVRNGNWVWVDPIPCNWLYAQRYWIPQTQSLRLNRVAVSSLKIFLDIHN